MSEIETREGVERAIAAVEAARRYVAEELAHARRQKAEDKSAGRRMQSAEYVTTSRDGIDLALGRMMGFSLKDFDAAIRQLRAARAPAQTQTFKDGFAAGLEAGPVCIPDVARLAELLHETWQHIDPRESDKPWDQLTWADQSLYVVSVEAILDRRALVLAAIQYGEDIPNAIRALKEPS